MIKLPFKEETFSEDTKERLSGVHLTYDYENIQSSLAKVARDMSNVLGNDTYLRLVELYETNVMDDVQKTAVDYLQRAMLHFAFYEHIIFIMLNIKNDGITVKKNDEETTAFAYMTDELKSTLISTAWFWMNELIMLMNANPTTFPEWIDSDQNKEVDGLGITYDEFNRWFNIDSWYFFIKTRYVIQEVMQDEILPRWTIDTSKKSLTDAMHRALAYKTMAIATSRFAYNELPEAIRKDVDNEQTKTSKGQEFTHIKEKVTKALELKAERYLVNLETLVSADRIQSSPNPPKTAVYVPTYKHRDDDKHFYPS